MSFPNLGKDATLVCPVPAVQKPVYAHLALFVNNAPDAQVKGNEAIAWTILTKEHMALGAPLYDNYNKILRFLWVKTFEWDGDQLLNLRSNTLKGVFTKNERGYRIIEKLSMVIATNLTSICFVYKEKYAKNDLYQRT